MPLRAVHCICATDCMTELLVCVVCLLVFIKCQCVNACTVIVINFGCCSCCCKFFNVVVIVFVVSIIVILLFISFINTQPRTTATQRQQSLARVSFHIVSKSVWPNTRNVFILFSFGFFFCVCECFDAFHFIPFTSSSSSSSTIVFTLHRHVFYHKL